MKIPEIIDFLLLLVTQLFEEQVTIQEDTFFQEFSDKLQEICRLAIDQKLETDDLIRLLTPLLNLLAENFSYLPIYRKKVLSILTESFSSLPLTFSLKQIDEKYVFVVEPKTISLSIQGSIMYETNAPTDCRTFLERFVRLYPEVTTPVIHFWILSMGIFKDIFSTFGDVLEDFYLPPKVPQGHPHPFRFIEGYREFYKFDLFDQIFTILNRSVPGLKITSKDFNEILDILKKVQEQHDEPRERYITFVFLSALIGFQLRDMLSDKEDKKRITDVLKIKEVEMLQRNVRAEVKMYYLSRVSLDFFKNRKTNTQFDYNYLKVAVTEFNENPLEFSKACDALQEFYQELNC